MKQVQYQRDFYEKNILVLENDIYAFILSRVKDYSDASDLRQIVMEKAWEHIDDLREPQKVKSWLFQIANREILQLFRKQKHQYSGRIEEDFFSLENLEDESNNVLDVLINRYEEETALAALKMLRPEEQELICMRYLDEFTPQEICTILREKPGTVRSKLSRCLRKYKEVFLTLERGEFNGK